MGFDEEKVEWEKLLLRAPLRVLLVEGDDSTRQIIIALLHKCGYRVTVTSDGLKAWEILRENGHNIDLVLTEVELPKMSGFVLLTMMMSHDICKNLPVIMMSSNDSISMAFKCMINGASDFLVKPIRKNELTNIWQHVWRKHKHQGESRTIPNKMVDLGYDCRSNENASDKQADMDRCEKESDAQSSCTRSDLEVESICKFSNKMEHKQEQLINLSPFDKTTKADNHFNKQLDAMSLFPYDEANGAVSFTTDMQSEGNVNCQKLCQNQSYTEVFDLIDVLHDQSPQHISSSENSRDNLAKNLLVDLDLGKKKNFMPSLELSLDRFPQILTQRQEDDESNTLHHSNSSAFSQYSNSWKVVPKLSQETIFQAQSKKSSSSSVESPPYQSPATPLHYNGLISELVDTGFMNAAFSHKQSASFSCYPIQFIPFPIPVGGMSFNPTASNSFIQPMFYPQSASSFWSPIPSFMQENFTENPEYQDDDHRKEEEAELADEPKHVLSEARGNTDNKGSVDEYGAAVACTESNSPVSFAKSGADAFPLSHREAALNKFRLKRKERCFEKKVRYLSRKKLAEQRPRVKGQFIRQR